MPEWQKRRTSVWRRAAWSWREAAAAHAKKNLNSVTYVSPQHSFVFPVSRKSTFTLSFTDREPE